MKNLSLLLRLDRYELLGINRRMHDPARRLSGKWLLALIVLAAIAAVGVAAPSVAVLSVVTVFYEQFRRNIYIARAMVGVRAAVVPIILSAAAGLRSIAIQEKVQYGIVLGGFLICLFLPINNILVVLLGAAAGLMLRGVRG